MAHGHRRFLLAAAGKEAPVLSPEVGGLAAPDRVGGFDEGGAEPLAPLAGLATQPLARALAVAGTHAGPRGEMARARKAGDVRADLGNEHLRGEAPHARDRIQPFDGRSLSGAQPLLDLAADALDLLQPQLSSKMSESPSIMAAFSAGLVAAAPV